MRDYTEENMLHRVEIPAIFVAVPGISQCCALCEEPIVPGESIVSGVDCELLHWVCVSFANEDCGEVQ